MTKPIILAALFFAAFATSLNAGNIVGKVTCQGKGVPGVQVSDGRDIVLTDAEGNYSLDSKKDQGFVFISTPSGYVPLMRDALQADFYAHLTEGVDVQETHDFELVEQNQDTYSVIFFTDAHITNDPKKKDLNLLHDVAAPALKNTAADLGQMGPVYLMQLGDFSHDLYWYKNECNLEDAYNAFLREGIVGPMYSVSGNHDNDAGVRTDNTDRDAEHLYRKILGPEYYSVNIGRQHWIFMDDVQYKNVVSEKMKQNKGVVGDRSYKHGFTGGEMEWLEKDLSFLPDTADVYLCVHVPVIASNESQTLFPVSQMDSLQAMFSRFGQIHVQTGHAHRTEFVESDKYPAFTEVIISAFSGNMWTSKPDRFVGEDGEPAGTLSFTFKGRDKDMHYWSHQFGEKNFRAVDMNQVADGRKYAPENKNVVYIEWWMARKGYSLQVLEGKKERPVEQITGKDPYLTMNVKENKQKSRHLFKVQAKTAKKPLVIREVRDSDGAVMYQETMRRPKPLVPGME